MSAWNAKDHFQALPLFEALEIAGHDTHAVDETAKHDPVICDCGSDLPVDPDTGVCVCCFFHRPSHLPRRAVRR